MNDAFFESIVKRILDRRRCLAFLCGLGFYSALPARDFDGVRTVCYRGHSLWILRDADGVHLGGEAFGLDPAPAPRGSVRRAGNYNNKPIDSLSPKSPALRTEPLVCASCHCAIGREPWTLAPGDVLRHEACEGLPWLLPIEPVAVPGAAVAAEDLNLPPGPPAVAGSGSFSRSTP